MHVHDDHTAPDSRETDSDVTDPLTGFPPSPPCRKTNAGHEVHFIQVKLSHDRDRSLMLLEDFRVHQDGRFTLIARGGDQITLWNHDPRRVHGLLDATLHERPDQPLHVGGPSLLKFPTDSPGQFTCVSAVLLHKITECNQQTVQDIGDAVMQGMGSMEGEDGPTEQQQELRRLRTEAEALRVELQDLHERLQTAEVNVELARHVYRDAEGENRMLRTLLAELGPDNLPSLCYDDLVAHMLDLGEEVPDRVANAGSSAACSFLTPRRPQSVRTA